MSWLLLILIVSMHGSTMKSPLELQVYAFIFNQLVGKCFIDKM